MEQRPAILGGVPAVTSPHPHAIWPPAASAAECDELTTQRNGDIGILGRSGPIAEFENRFLQFLENRVRYAVTFNSGTSGLYAAYVALGLGEGDEVIGPALTYHAALSPLFAIRATPVLVDVDRHTRCLTPSKVEAAITGKTRAITVVHQWGHPADMDAILDIARRHNIRVVEDCSHAQGSRLRGYPCGAFGDIAVFSLQASKMIYAGEGGILVTNNEAFHDRAVLIGHYRDRAREEVIDAKLRQYWVTGFGLKLRMSALNAVVAKHSLMAYPERRESRHRCLRYFNEKLRSYDFLELHEPMGDVDMGSWYGFKPLYLQERLHGLTRQRFIEALRAEGVEVTAPSGGCLDTLPFYKAEQDPLFGITRPSALHNRMDLCEAKLIEAQALSLPTFTNWPEDQHIIDEYVDAFAKVSNAASEISHR